MTYHDEDGRRWSHLLDLDHGQDLGHLSLAGAGVEKAAGGEEDPVDAPEGGHGHEHGDHEREVAVQALGERLELRTLII